MLSTVPSVYDQTMHRLVTWALSDILCLRGILYEMFGCKMHILLSVVLEYQMLGASKGQFTSSICIYVQALWYHIVSHQY